jgi:hypothetical protein
MVEKDPTVGAVDRLLDDAGVCSTGIDLTVRQVAQPIFMSLGEEGNHAAGCNSQGFQSLEGACFGFAGQNTLQIVLFHDGVEKEQLTVA